MTTAAGPRSLDVLVVDDDATLRTLFVDLLRDLGHRVAAAADGAEAVRLAGEGRFDLVLMDCEMPVLDGLAAAREIRALPGPPMPIVMISSRDDAATRDAAVAAGIDRYLAKPLSVATLKKLVGAYAGA